MRAPHLDNSINLLHPTKHEAVIDAMQRRLKLLPNAMGIRRRTGEHVFGTLKSWMGSTH